MRVCVIGTDGIIGRAFSGGARDIPTDTATAYSTHKQTWDCQMFQHLPQPTQARFCRKLVQWLPSPYPSLSASNPCSCTLPLGLLNRELKAWGIFTPYSSARHPYAVSVLELYLHQRLEGREEVRERNKTKALNLYTKRCSYPNPREIFRKVH